MDPMKDLSLRKPALVAFSLRERLVENRIDRHAIQEVAALHNLPEGEVIGIARDLSIEVLLEERSPAKPQTEKVSRRRPVSDLVLARIARGSIYKLLMPIESETPEAEIEDRFAMVRLGALKREREAIDKLLTWYERELQRLEIENTILRNAPKSEKVWIPPNDEDIARRDPDSFFRKLTHKIL